VSGFSADWLTLREPSDAAARATALLRRLPRDPARARRVIVDLAAGTGANFRYLAPRLGGAQDWVLVDHDPQLLDTVEPALRAWAQQIGAHVDSETDCIVVTAPTYECRVKLKVLDLAANLRALDLPSGALVTCSALLDLVGEAWLAELADRCRNAWAPVVFALSYDGRMLAEPADALDETALALFNRHQRGDKGFGPALGPAATETAVHIFAEQGYTLAAESSDWELDQAAAKLQAAILDGWLGAALEIAPERRVELVAWHARRGEHVRRGRATLTVGHRDLAGWLPG
jgi:hypothetical protein